MNSGTSHNWSRRALLGVGLGVGIGAVAGCSDVSTATTRPAPTGTPTTTSPRPTPTKTPVLHPPTRTAMVRQFGGERPHEWGLTVTGMALGLSESAARKRQVALTFDACGGGRHSPGCGIDRKLIDLLRHHRAKATLFLNKRWIEANPGYAKALAEDPLFEIGNHGARHMPLSVSGRTAYSEQGTRSVGDAYDEVMGNYETLIKLTGHPPRWFRSGTAHADEVAVRMVKALGLDVVNFSINGDAGTTFTASQIVQSVGATKPGDIIISHMNRPEHDTAEGYARALPALLDRGLHPVTLSEGMRA